MSTYNDNLRWRYATKKFDSAKKLTQVQIDDLLESTQLAASSFGLQPYKVFVITDPALRERIKEHAWGQTQVTDASHLVVFCAYKTIDESYVDAFIALVSEIRGIPVESLKDYREMMVGSIKGRSTEALANWMKCQAYIGLGFLLSAAAQATIDACPMEGFDPSLVDGDLQLSDKNLTAVAMCPLGFRASDDRTAAYKKVRFPKEELFVFTK
jgi:nitroreductase